VETGRGRRSTGRQLGRFLKTMGAASDVAPAPRMVASTGGGAPSSSGLTQEVLIQQEDSASSDGYGG
jgi:hypothetical protein